MEEAVEKKVKDEQKPPKVEDSSEAEMLKRLLAQKTDEALQREVKLRTEIIELEKQNKRLKAKRAGDAARIESLEAELARAKKAKKKTESPAVCMPKKERLPEDSIMIMDSEDEQENDASDPNPAPADVDTTSLTVSTRPPADPPRPFQSERPGRDAWSPLTPEGSTPRRDTDSDTDPKVKDEVVDVIIKTEGEPDQFKRVTLIKSEAGNFDIWNVDGFGLGPTIKVPEKYNRGFTRRVICDAFGGGLQSCEHHFKPKRGQANKTPFVTLNRTWNHALPTDLGGHGMGFISMDDSPIKPAPMNFFAGEGVNNWRLLGTYNYLRWGEIATHHVQLLPPSVLDNWVNGIVEAPGGKAWIEDVNSELEDARKLNLTTDSVLEGIRDGRVKIPFVILQCVGYPKDWFERLVHYEKNPKPREPSKNNSSTRKRAGRKVQGSPKKKAKTERKGNRAIKEESDDESEGQMDVDAESGNSDSDYFDGTRKIVELPKRTSPRKAQRKISPEL
ncbi:hypothetical protein C8R43DRAFT_967933 [Mycena crocata]|nr:hypothetical protein C8R43DRAFT_967933 [Mycena crocata]